MIHRPLFLASASLIAFGFASASAQEVDYVDECVDLFSFVEDSPTLDLESDPTLVAVIERNDARACQLRLTRLQREARAAVADGAQMESETQTESETTRQVNRTAEGETTTETRTMQEQVQLEETVTVQGDVAVVVGTPSVSIRPEPATVRVQGEPPRVTVTQEQPEVVIRERPATITVGMPTITIEQEAPEIIITMPEPGVDVAMAEPRVEVRQPAPRVSVAVPEPEVDLDLRAVAGEGDGPVRTNVTRRPGQSTPEQGMQQVQRGADGGDADVYVSEAEPQVEMSGMDGEPQIDIQETPEPNIRFERAEPNVEVSGEPEVRFERTGEPTVRIQRASNEQASQRPQQAASTENVREPQTAQSGSSETMTARDLTGRSVRGENGDEIGSIERIVRLNGAPHAIIEHGGFLGLGDTDIPVPLSDLYMQGDELIASGMTAERAEQMQAQDLERGEDVRGRERLQIQRR